MLKSGRKLESNVCMFDEHNTLFTKQWKRAVKNGRDFHCCVRVRSRAPVSTLTTVHELVSSSNAFMSEGSVAVGRVHSLYHVRSCPPYLFIKVV